MDRVVQYKMILKRDLIPTQDDPENVRRRGGLRPDANTHAERRSTDQKTARRVFEGQRRDRVPSPKPGRTVRLGPGSISRAGIRCAGQETAWSDSSLPEQNHRTQPAASDAMDPPIPAGGRGASGRVPA